MGLEGLKSLITEEGLYQDTKGTLWRYQKSPVREEPYILVRLSDKHVRLFWESGISLDLNYPNITKSLPQSEYPEMYL